MTLEKEQDGVEEEKSKPCTSGISRLSLPS